MNVISNVKLTFYFIYVIYDIQYTICCFALNSVSLQGDLTIRWQIFFNKKIKHNPSKDQSHKSPKIFKLKIADLKDDENTSYAFDTKQYAAVKSNILED